MVSAHSRMKVGNTKYIRLRYDNSPIFTHILSGGCPMKLFRCGLTLSTNISCCVSDRESCIYRWQDVVVGWMMFLTASTTRWVALVTGTRQRRIGWRMLLTDLDAVRLQQQQKHTTSAWIIVEKWWTMDWHYMLGKTVLTSLLMSNTPSWIFS